MVGKEFVIFGKNRFPQADTLDVKGTENTGGGKAFVAETTEDPQPIRIVEETPNNTIAAKVVFLILSATAFGV